MRVHDALKATGIDRIDAEMLLAAVLGCDRAALVARSEDVLGNDMLAAWTLLLERRRASEPVAYILGRQEFYGREFIVGSGVLVPRPSTEGVVRMALEFLRNAEEKTEEVDSGIVVCSRRMRAWEKSPQLIVDVGTGSGCIAITLALELAATKITATDVSQDALHIAEKNVKHFHLEKRVTLKCGDGLMAAEKIAEPFLLVSNPPYIPEGTLLMPDVGHFEPGIALYGGKGGTHVLEKLVADARLHPLCCAFIVECRRDQLGSVDGRRPSW